MGFSEDVSWTGGGNCVVICPHVSGIILLLIAMSFLIFTSLVSGFIKVAVTSSQQGHVKTAKDAVS